MTDTDGAASGAPRSGRGAAAGGGLLDRVRAQRAAEADAARATVQLAVAWAAAHPASGIAELPVTEVHADHEVELAGPGAPGVSEFAVIELAAALGMSIRAGRSYLGDALELAHRLPGVWARVLAGELPAWRARTIAQATKQLSAPAATWIDQRVGPVAHRLGPARLQRLVDQAMTLFDPESAVAQTMTETYVSIIPMAGAASGLADLAQIHGVLHLPDALALDAALGATAHRLRELYPDRSLEERRALALSHLAHATPTSPRPHPSTTDSHTNTNTGTGGAGARERELALVVHLGGPDLGPAQLGRISAGGPSHGVLAGLTADRLVSVEAVSEWCARPGAKVIIRPVIDLGAQITCPGYVPSPSLREQVMLLSPTCAFPHCPVPAQRCDLDHIVPWDEGGPTTTSNMGPLCRTHHRVKTMGGWTYTQREPGVYHWTSPSGHRYQRDRDGTTDLGARPPARHPDDEEPSRCGMRCWIGT